MLLAVLGKIIGAITGLLCAFYFILPTVGLYDSYIPTVNGRPCNGKGTYSLITFKCNCLPQWSGRACEYTACPGYQPFSGAVCFGNGDCSPLLTSSQVPEVCQGDWSSKKCKNHLLTVDPGLITCLCNPPYDGPQCDISGCPISASGLDCSGNGNLSVSLLRNNSNLGTGCQCTTPFGFLQLRESVSANTLRLLPSLTYFRLGLCATTTTGPSGELRLTRGSYKCYCNALFSGEVCEIGACPDFNGKLCNDKGHPMLGDGFEENITIAGSVPSNCYPICKPPYVSDGSVCTVKPGVIMDCPKERPYRCSNGDCVSGADQFCLANLETGFHSRPEEISVNCQGNPASCGIRELESSEIVILRPEFSFNSRLVYWQIAIISASVFPIDMQIKLREKTIIERFASPGTFQGIIPDISLDAWELNAFINPITMDVMPVSEFSVILYPSITPFAIGTFLRIGLENVVQVTSIEYSEQNNSTFPIFLAVVTPQQIYITRDGILVDYGVCQNDIISCLWYGDEMKSAQNLYLCQVGTSSFLRSPTPCSIPWSRRQRIEISNRASARIPYTSLLFGVRDSRLVSVLDTNYTAQTIVRFTHDGSQVTDLRANITTLKFLTREDHIMKPCICPPTEDNLGNQTEQNFFFFNTRSEKPSVPGEHGVFKYNLYGDAVTTRGVLISADPPRFLDDATLTDKTFFDSRLISSREYRSGRKPCILQSARTTGGDCSTLSLVRVEDGLVQCSCLYRQGLCTCVTEFNETVYRSIPVALLNQTCQYVPNIETVEPRIVNESANFIIYQTTQFPLSFTGLNINVSVSLNAAGPWEILATETSEFENRVLDYRGGDTLYFKFDFETFTQVRWVDYGFKVDTPHYIVASSNQDLTGNIEWNTRTYWESEEELDPWIRLVFNSTTFVSGLVVEYESLGVFIEDSLILEVSSQILVQLEGDTRWTLLKIVTDKIAEGSILSFVDVGYWIEAVEVRSSYQFRLRQLQAFTNQYCQDSRVRIVPGIAEKQANTLWDLEDPGAIPCTCLDNCTVGGIDVSRDGYCNDIFYATRDLPTPEPVTSDEIVFDFGNSSEIVTDTSEMREWLFYNTHNYSTFELRAGSLYVYYLTNSSAKVLRWYKANLTLTACPQDFNGQVLNLLCTPVTTPGDYAPEIRQLSCGMGFDCSDCGSSWRRNDSEPRASCIPRRQTVESNFYLSELIDVVGVAEIEIKVNFTEPLSRLYVDCPWPTRCPDGSCQRVCDSPTLYNCRGNGCVRQSNFDKRYKCACQVGWAGTACQIHECVPMDAVTGLTDPHAVCATEGPGGLKVKPPFRQALPDKRAYTTAQIEIINRRGRAQYGPTDLRWEYVQSDHAPYGEAIQRYYYEAGKLVYTTCPFLVRDAMGVLRQFEDLVAERADAFPYPVTTWRELDTPSGGTTTIQPKSLTQYDDAPFRCSNGECTSKSTSCSGKPMCGGRGVAMADGSCECYPEWETFVFTEKESERARVPYDRFNPTRWGFPQELPPEMALSIYTGSQCNARNCSTVDCFIPRGCFPGTKSLGFTDKQYTCKTGLYKGKCALDEVSCVTGQGITDPLICSGKGIPQKREYRDEYYCVCGDSASSVAPTELSHLIPNGFGGLACQHYYCEETQVIRYVQFNPLTGKPFENTAGQRLPGRWLAGCNGPAGPSFDPSEVDSGSYQQWAACCPDGIETCLNVLCRIRNEIGIGSDKSVCMRITDCIGEGRSPEIYECNNHGKLLSAGTCECDFTETFGYTYDFRYFSYKGCYKKVGCKVASTSKRMCNKKDTCGGDLDIWTDFPRLDYMEQQLPIVASLESLAMTNKSIVLRLLPGLTERNRLVVQSYSELALRVISDIRSLDSDVCIYPNDTADSLYAMAPLSEARAKALLPYGKILNHAALLSINSLGKLTDKIIFANCTDGADLSGGPLLVTFGDLTSVKLVRLYQRGSGTVSLSYYNPTIDFVETQSRQLTSTDCSWIEWVLEALYIDFNYKLEVPFLYLNKCPVDESESTCKDWLKSYCENVVKGVFREKPTNSVLRGCSLYSKCCIPTTSDVPPVQNITLTWQAGAAISEIQFYGYRINTIPTMPRLFQQEISDYVGQETTCRDDLLMNIVFKARGTLFVASSISTFNSSQAFELCQERAGVLVSDNDEEKVGEPCKKGECFTAGREISTPENPTRDYFFSCKDFGCYTLLTAPPSWYYVTSTYDETGVLWQSQRVSGQLAASQWYLGWLQIRIRGLQSLHQYPGRLLTPYFFGLYGRPKASAVRVVFSGCGGEIVNPCFAGLPVKSPCPAFAEHCRRGSCYTQPNQVVKKFFSQFLFAFGSEFRNYDTSKCTVDTGGGIVRKFPDPSSLGTIEQAQSYLANLPLYEYASDPYPENTAKYWTSEPVCKVIFYNDQYCGADFANYQGTFYLQANRDVAYREFIYTSANYDAFETTFSLSSFVFDKCTQSASSCPGISTVSLAGKNIKSFAFQGECILSLSKSTDSTAGSWGFFTENQYGASPAFRVLGVMVLDDIEDVVGSTRVVEAPKGCRMNLFEPEYHRGILPITDDIGFFRVFPKFSADLIKHTIHSEMNPTTGTDQYSMGFLTHQYMCTHHQIEVVAKVIHQDYPQNIGGVWRRGYVNLASSPIVLLRREDPILVKGSLVVGADRVFPSASIVYCRSQFPGFTSCREAIVTRDRSDWRWMPLLYGNNFPNEILRMKRYSLPGTNPPRTLTSIYTTFTLGAQTRTETLTSIEYTFSRVFARHISWLKATDYDIKFQLDRCVAVKTVTFAGAPRHEFVPSLCKNLNIPVVCAREYYPYTSPAGLMCDVCGPLSRTNVIEPGVLPINKFPLANSTAFPFEHSVKDAYLAGDLDILIATADNQETQYDFIMGYIAKYSTRSIILAFPKVRQWLVDEYSTRPVFTSPGETENPSSWVDFRFNSWFPYACAKTRDPSTGISRFRCATKLDQCAYTTQQAPMMARGDIPEIITSGITPSVSDPRCGSILRPIDFIKTDYWGFTVNQPCNILEATDEFVAVELIGFNLTFENTGKKQYVLPRQNITWETGINVYSTATCNSACQVRIDVTTYETNYQSPPRRYRTLVQQNLAAGSLSELLVEDLTLTDSEFSQLRWVIICLEEENCIATLFPIIVTSTSSLLECSRAQTSISWRELPTVVDSAAPDHQCMFEDGGYCDCSASSPFGGPACEWPAGITIYGKQVCSLYGAISGVSFPDKYPVNELGVYFDEQFSSFSCKCTNPGISLYVRLRQITVDPFFVIRYDDIFGVSQYGFVAPSSDIPVPVSHYLLNYVRIVCGSDSSIVPSFISGDELTLFLANAPEPGILLDISVVDNTTFKWDQRNIELGDIDWNIPYVDVNSLGLAQYTNLNNLLYLEPGLGGDPILVDGYSNRSISAPNNFDVILPDSDFTNSYRIEIDGDSSPVFTTIPSSACTYEGGISWACIEPQSIEIFVTTATEIRMFHYTQTTRFLT